MKKMLFTFAVLLMGTVAHAHQANPNGLTAKQYACIAQRMQATNSDIWCNLTPSEVDAILSNEAAIGHDVAVTALTTECAD